MIVMNGQLMGAGLGQNQYACAGNVCKATNTTMRAVFINLQKALNRLGGAQVGVDGDIGPRTADAVGAKAAAMVAGHQYVTQPYRAYLAEAGKLLGRVTPEWVAASAPMLLTGFQQLVTLGSLPSAVTTTAQMPVFTLPEIPSPGLPAAVATPGGKTQVVTPPPGPAPGVAPGTFPTPPARPRRWPWVVAGVGVLALAGIVIVAVTRKPRKRASAHM